MKTEREAEKEKNTNGTDNRQCDIMHITLVPICPEN